MYSERNRQSSGRVSARCIGMRDSGKLMVMVGWEGAANHGACSGQVNGQLAGDGGVLDVRHAFWGQQRRQDYWPFWPASLAASGASEPTGRPRSSPTLNTWRARRPAPVRIGSPVFRQQFAQFIHQRQDGVSATVHQATANLDHLQPRQQADGAHTGHRAGECTVLQGLTRPAPSCTSFRLLYC